MIESAMYFGLGFLASGLLGLIVLHFAWQQATRLTRQRVEAAVPLNLEEIRADKDRMRAEFALKNRKLEKLLEDAQAENARHRLELDTNSEFMRTMVAERDAKADNVVELESRGDELRQSLRTREDELVRTSAALREAERTLKSRTEETAELREKLASSVVAPEPGSKEESSLLSGLQSDLASRVAALSDAEKRIATLEDENAALRIKLVHHSISSSDKETPSEAEAGDTPPPQEAEKMTTESVFGESADKIALSAQILELEARNAEADAEVQRLTVELEQVKAAQPSGTAGERDVSVSNEETDALRDELKSLAATIAFQTAAAEGESSPINAILAASGENAAAEAPGGAGSAKKESIVDRIRRLAMRAESAAKDKAAEETHDA